MFNKSDDIIEIIANEIDNLIKSHFINERIVKIPLLNDNLSNIDKITDKISIITSIIQKGDKKLLLYDNVFLYIYIKYKKIDKDYINLHIKIEDNKDNFNEF